MPAGIFSTYRQGENRVTSTFLAVMERISLAKTERILGALLGDDTFQLVRFDNQVREGESVPDARIRASVSISLETKTTPGAVREDQLRNHLKTVESNGHLLVLTPDSLQPLLTKSDPRISWANFRALADAVNSVLADPNEPPTELESFLLRQFLSLLLSDGLLQSPEDNVLVVAANRAFDEYLRYSAYICQPKRTFQAVSHMAFYANGRIQSLVPRVLTTVEEVTLTEKGIAAAAEEEAREGLMGVLAGLEKSASPRSDEVHKVILLSSPEDSATLRLAQDILNDRPNAFTQGHRYVSLSSIGASPRTTTELLELQQ